MKGFKVTFFLIFIAICLIQTIRHVYVLFNYDKPTVLYKYDFDAANHYIKESESLDSLVIKFDSVHTAIKQFEKGKNERVIDSLRREDGKLYDKEQTYREAIENWEAKENAIHETIVFWSAGLLLLIAGVFVYYKKIKWLGLALILPGVTEMIWWTSPVLTLSGAQIEFLKFLTIKLVLSFITLTGIILVWLLSKEEVVDKM